MCQDDKKADHKLRSQWKKAEFSLSKTLGRFIPQSEIPNGPDRDVSYRPSKQLTRTTVAVSVTGAQNLAVHKIREIELK